MRALALAFLAAVTTAEAQVVLPCDELASAAYLYEPWEQNTRQYANGAIRVAELDTYGEPAGLSARLLVLAPGQELGPLCGVVAQSAAFGWADVDIAGISASYDAARGLLLMVPVDLIDPNTSRPIRRFVGVRINQATQTISVE